MLQILKLAQAHWRRHQAVATNSETTQLRKLTDILTQLQALEEGICITKEVELLGSSQVTHLKWKWLLGVEKCKVGTLHTTHLLGCAVIHTLIPQHNAIPHSHWLRSIPA